MNYKRCWCGKCCTDYDTGTFEKCPGCQVLGEQRTIQERDEAGEPWCATEVEPNSCIKCSGKWWGYASTFCPHCNEKQVNRCATEVEALRSREVTDLYACPECHCKFTEKEYYDNMKCKCGSSIRIRLLRGEVDALKAGRSCGQCGKFGLVADPLCQGRYWCPSCSWHFDDVSKLKGIDFEHAVFDGLPPPKPHCTADEIKALDARVKLKYWEVLQDIEDKTYGAANREAVKKQQEGSHPCIHCKCPVQGTAVNPVCGDCFEAAKISSFLPQTPFKRRIAEMHNEMKQNEAEGWCYCRGNPPHVKYGLECYHEPGE